ncbi:hypothetical protein RND71_035567 [Anisodus tanguticus]|uniref:HVA22-like protein n=1 Tax=Anisodus tanguticus TaxID=243964 RepID=A0AAE1R559_9SOLA|nr:hypothetical protein RND71_035567 [Anisodus tanguticus]
MYQQYECEFHSAQVGLRLLFSPLGPNIVVRTACCSVGVALPVYSTFKAIEGRDENEQEKWLLYWAAYGSFSIVELFTDKFLHWFPLYYHTKFAFLVWLQLPTTDSKFVSVHQAEIQFVRALLMKNFVSANQFASDFIHPERRHVSGAIEGPRQQVDTSDSEDEE